MRGFTRDMYPLFCGQSLKKAIITFLYVLVTLSGVITHASIVDELTEPNGDDLCSAVHSLFDVNIVSDSEPGEDNLYNTELIKDLLKRNLPDEDDIRRMQMNNVKKFIEVSKSSRAGDGDGGGDGGGRENGGDRNGGGGGGGGNGGGGGVGDMNVNQCYLDPSKESDSSCKYARIYQISKLYYHDVINLYRYFKSNGRTRVPFDLYVHWIELGDFYLLHPDVTAVCPQTTRRKCQQPETMKDDEQRQRRLVFQPICYHRFNTRYDNSTTCKVIYH